MDPTNTQIQTQTSPTSGEGANTQGTQTQQSQEGQGGASPSKPEWLPDNYWDGDAGSVKFEDLGKTFNDLTAFKAAQESRLAAVPETPDGYEVKLPADYKLPEGYEFNADGNDPMLAFGREVAKAVGLDQVGFEGLVGKYAEYQVKQNAELAQAVKANMEALGPKATERVGAAKTFLAAKIGPSAHMFDYVLQTKDGVEAVERLMHLATSGGSPAFSQSGREASAPKSAAELFYPNQAKG